MVPEVGFEPTRACAHELLRLACLPFHALRPTQLVYGNHVSVSCFRSYGEIEPSDVVSARDRQQLRSTDGPMHAVIGARGAEDVPDAARLVAEVIPGIVSAVHAVEDTAAVRVDEPSQKRAWMLSGDVTLPLPQCDRSLMFRARRMLRKETWPMLPPSVHDDASFGTGVTDTPPTDRCHRPCAFGDDVRILRVEADPETIDVPAVSRQATISEVEAEQIGVGRLV